MQAFQQLEAAHVRQCQIQDHAVVDGFTEGFQGRLAAGDGGDLHALLVEQLADAFMLDGAVLHHQQAPHIGLDGGFDLGEGAEHLLLADRLGEEVDGAQVQRFLAFVLAGQEVHRNILGAGVRLELLHHLPAVDAGQPDIENNGAGPVAARVLETGFTVMADVAFQAVIRRQVHQYVGELAVVLDHQHGLFADHEAVVVLAFQRQIGGGVRLGVGADVHRFRRRRPVVGLLALPGMAFGQVEHEGGAGAGAVAVQADFPAQQARQLPRDGQPQTGAAVFAAGGAVGLLEGLEDQFLLVLGDAHAGVGDREFKRAGTVQTAGDALVLAGALDAQGHGAVVGEFERVGKQVFQNLFEPLTVGIETGRQPLALGHVEGHVAVLGDVAEVALEVIAQLRRRDGVHHHVHLAFFDLGNIQDVVDQ